MPRSVQIAIFWVSGVGEGGSLKSKPKVPRSVQISIFRGGGWCSGKSKPKVPRSVQISILGGGGGLEKQNPKCQDLQSAKICPNFNFRKGGCSGKSKPKVPRSVQILIWGGGGGCSEPNSRTGCSVQFGQKFLEA